MYILFLNPYPSARDRAFVRSVAIVITSTRLSIRVAFAFALQLQTTPRVRRSMGAASRVASSQFSSSSSSRNDVASSPSRRRARAPRAAAVALADALLLLLACGARVGTVSLARADAVSDAVERAISRSRGLQAYGALDRLLERLREATCAANAETCESVYESMRRELWMTLGRDAIGCGVGEDENATWSAIDETNTQGGFATLLGECVRPFLGDLEAEVLSLSATFLKRVSLQRADVKAVLDMNDEKAGRNASSTSRLDLDALYPAYLPNLAPVATELTGFSTTRPIVVTADGDLDIYGINDANVVNTITAKLDSWKSSNLAKRRGDTEAFPNDYVRQVEKEREEHLRSRGEEPEYWRYYLKHPYHKAHYDKEIKCEGRPASDTLCHRRVVQQIGYTHAEDGTRLLSVSGEPLPSDYKDYNQPYLYPEYQPNFTLRSL